MPAAEIPFGVTLAVLAAGFLHALWNALLKSASGEPMLDTALIVAGATIVCAPLVLVVPFPAPAAWPFALASMLVHFGYYVTLAGAYRRGDLSFAYPLMRGVAPLLVTLAGVAVLGEHLRPNAIAGIALISGGIVLIAWFASGRHTASAVRWAIANAAIIATYTLIDGAGARAAGNPWSYAFWLMFLEGIPFVGWIVWLHRGDGEPLPAAPLASRHAGRGRQRRRLRDRAVGDDARSGGGRCRTARGVGGVRRDPRRRVPERAVRLAAPGGRGERRRRRGRAAVLRRLPCTRACPPTPAS